MNFGYIKSYTLTLHIYNNKVYITHKLKSLKDYIFLVSKNMNFLY